MDIRLVVTDMDGTLLDGARRLPRRFGALARGLAGRGVGWAIASGRQLANLRAQFDPIGAPVALIAENGALAAEPGAARPFFEDLTPAACFADVLREALATPGATPVLCGADRAWVGDAHPGDWPEIGQFFAVREPWHALGEVLGLRVCKVAVFHPRAAEALFPRLSPLGSPGLRVILSGPQWVDVQPARIDKANALRALLARRGLRPGQAIVFGDYLNDAGMMAVGARAVAMGNAHPALRARCAEVAPPNTENGVLRHLRALGLLRHPRGAPLC